MINSNDNKGAGLPVGDKVGHMSNQGLIYNQWRWFKSNCWFLIGKKSVWLRDSLTAFHLISVCILFSQTYSDDVHPQVSDPSNWSEQLLLQLIVTNAAQLNPKWAI